MSYTQTHAVAGNGVQLSIGPVTGTSSPTYVPIYEIKDFSFMFPTWDTVDVTNLNSSAYQELLETMRKWEPISITGNFVGTDPGQLALEAAYTAGGSYMFQFVFPKANGQTSAGNTVAFNALVVGFGASDFSPTKEVGLSAKLQPTGTFTLTVGS